MTNGSTMNKVVQCRVGFSAGIVYRIVTAGSSGVVYSRVYFLFCDAVKAKEKPHRSIYPMGRLDS